MNIFVIHFLYLNRCFTMLCKTSRLSTTYTVCTCYYMSKLIIMISTEWVPEATSSSCGKCTEKQKALVAKTIKAIKEKLPKEYTALISQSDPDGKYTADLEAFIAKYSV